MRFRDELRNNYFWLGNYPRQEAQILSPSSFASIREAIKPEVGLIARGMGRSYGDSANGTKVIQTSYCDHFIEFEEKSGTLTAEAGITLREILKIVVPAGWFCQSHLAQAM